MDEAGFWQRPALGAAVYGGGSFEEASTINLHQTA